MGSKGFGSIQAAPSQKARKFILAFKQYMDAHADLKDVNQFFDSHLSELDESLLKSLPLIFRDLTKNKKPKELSPIAAVFENFGAALYQFPLGDRALNIELGLIAHQLALKVFTRSAFPETWAGIQNNLGNAYSTRIRGERAENLEKAIAADELALQVYTRESFPVAWALAHNNIGLAYRDRILGERNTNFERAIESFELAL
jgi:tetratricopeptide (TPR) repeat protein